MPLYTYHCACGRVFDAVNYAQGGAYYPRECPDCGKTSTPIKAPPKIMICRPQLEDMNDRH